MYKFKLVFIIVSIAATLLAGCLPAQPTVPVDVASIVSATLTAVAQQPQGLPVTVDASLLTPPTLVAVTPAVPSPEVSQLLAFMRDGKLIIFEIKNGIPGNIKEYPVAGIDNYPMEIVWSPSGDHLVFSAQTNNESHLFLLWDVLAGSPVDLGPGSGPAWSPDGQSIAYIGGQFPHNNLWITPLPNLAPRQLTFEQNFSWGSVTFTPDGSSLLSVGQSQDMQGANGNFLSYALEYVSLDGSGQRHPFQSGTPQELLGARLPADLEFSQNGKWLGLSVSSHISAACATGGAYAISADGSLMQPLRSSSLNNIAAGNPALVALPGGYAWSPASESAAVSSGGVLNCDMARSDFGQIVAGPQLSVIGLDGIERLVIPGLFYGFDYDCTGTLLAVSHYQNNQDINPNIEIYSSQNGQWIAGLGPGMSPSFQPSASCPIAR